MGWKRTRHPPGLPPRQRRPRPSLLEEAAPAAPEAEEKPEEETEPETPEQVGEKLRRMGAELTLRCVLEGILAWYCSTLALLRGAAGPCGLP